MLSLFLEITFILLSLHWPKVLADLVSISIFPLMILRGLLHFAYFLTTDGFYFYFHFYFTGWRHYLLYSLPRLPRTSPTLQSARSKKNALHHLLFDASIRYFDINSDRRHRLRYALNYSCRAQWYIVHFEMIL
jgi:hypothetical protein